MTTKERPILFSAPMVLAIMDGRKNQTRRLVKFKKRIGTLTNDEFLKLCPHGKIGDRLWVRETFSYHEIPEGEPFYYPADRLRECVDHDYGFHYWADGQPEFGNWTKPKPSIHMPRWASRILLEITNVRVERLNDISEDDAIAEGCFKFPFEDDHAYTFYEEERIGHATHTGAYRKLWESINGQGSWDLNPWVWTIEFKVISK